MATNPSSQLIFFSCQVPQALVIHTSVETPVWICLVTASTRRSYDEASNLQMKPVNLPEGGQYHVALLHLERGCHIFPPHLTGSTFLRLKKAIHIAH